MDKPSNEEHREMLDLLQRAHSWIDSLQVSGVSENVAVSAVMMALVERAVRAGGVIGASHWLKGHVALVEKLGPMMKH